MLRLLYILLGFGTNGYNNYNNTSTIINKSSISQDELSKVTWL